MATDADKDGRTVEERVDLVETLQETIDSLTAEIKSDNEVSNSFEELISIQLVLPCTIVLKKNII